MSLISSRTNVLTFSSTVSKPFKTSSHSNQPQNKWFFSGFMHGSVISYMCRSCIQLFKIHQCIFKRWFSLGKIVEFTFNSLQFPKICTRFRRRSGSCSYIVYTLHKKRFLNKMCCLFYRSILMRSLFFSLPVAVYVDIFHYCIYKECIKKKRV